VSRLLNHPVQTAIWAFVVVVAAYDIGWALCNRDTFEMWEANPAMKWVMAAHGVPAAALVRALTVAFAAAVVPRAPWRSRTPATVAALAAHLYLAGAYASIALST
jgi:hypothetical protein